MKKRTRNLILALAALPVLFVVYALIVIIDARIDTPDILRSIRTSGVLQFDAARLPPGYRRILLLVEDPAFFAHKGIDLVTPGAGLTTITQALVKRLYFKQFKPGFAKLRQSLIALFVLDRMLSKEEQLTFFLNLMYFGKTGTGPAWGITAAAKGYFNKRVEALSRREFISLIALLIAPAAFNPRTRPEAHRERVRRIEALAAGRYVPTKLMDQYYGPLDSVTAANQAPMSYFPSLYRTNNAGKK